MTMSLVKDSTPAVLVLISLLFTLCKNAQSQLMYGYYNKSCPLAELIVEKEVNYAYHNIDKGLAAGLVRMQFHDCFVEGCDGSVLIDSTPNNTAEKDSPINNPSLRGFDVIYSAKAKLELVCKGIVSCADIVVFAARDSVAISKGVRYQVPSGRRDGRVSLASETFTNLPAPTSNIDQLTKSFLGKNLTKDDVVTLSGAHTIGRSHCTSFQNRLYNFSSTSTQDPTLDPNYARTLKEECPSGQNNTFVVVPMDPYSPTVFDASYFKDVLNHQGLFTSDQTLISESYAAAEVMKNANYPSLWMAKFADAMVRMSTIGVKTGTQGEIRVDCRKINN